MAIICFVLEHFTLTKGYGFVRLAYIVDSVPLPPPPLPRSRIKQIEFIQAYYGFNFVHRKIVVAVRVKISSYRELLQVVSSGL